MGYLSDDTMIAVNHARPPISKVVAVMVSSALQTDARRLVLAELKDGAEVS